MSDDGSEIPPPLTLDQVQKLVSEAISAEREAIDARFVEQEHRGARVLVNWYDGIRSGKPTLKRSAWLALLWNFLLPRPTTVALAAGGLATLAVTALGVAMAYRANLLLERQNVRLDVQNFLPKLSDERHFWQVNWPSSRRSSSMRKQPVRRQTVLCRLSSLRPSLAEWQPLPLG